MRRCIAVIFAAVLMVVLAACGQKEESNSVESVISAPSEETAITESDSQSSPPESEDTGSHILITYFSVPENIDISGVDAVAGASVVVRNSEKMVKAAMGGASSGGNGTDEYTKIMGNAVATAEQMKAYLKAKNPSVAQSALDMVSLYLSEGKAEGVRGDIAFAQSCLETGNFTFSGSAGTLSQNNFCGMGVTSNGVKGNSFDTPQLGIRAQVQHLKAYASTDALKNACIAPRFKYVTRGCAEYVEWLGQKENPAGKGWAAGAGYGGKILSILKGILGTAGGAPKPAPAETEAWYRVRKSWADASSQKGAFKSLENAKKCADENPGYSVFDESRKAVYTRTAAFKPYLVRVSIPDLNIRKGPSTDHAKTGKYTGVGAFTIVEEADGKGASRWGLLKSYQNGRNGWVSLDYAKKV